MKQVAEEEIHRYRRFRGYDYSRGAALFITVVTNPRRRLFGEIVDARLRKTQLGLDPRQIDEAVRRIRWKVGNYVFVGGWISPGEKAVRGMPGGQRSREDDGNASVAVWT